MKSACGLAFAALFAVHGLAAAQLKPSGPGTPSLPPGPTEAWKKDAQAAKELAARGAAEKWIALLDAGDYGKAWDESAEAFRARVPRQQWLDSIPNTRAPFGKAKSRRVEIASYRGALAGAPAGEYVTVRFGTSFEKKDDAEELITLVLERGAWRPVGYGVR